MNLNALASAITSAGVPLDTLSQAPDGTVTARYDASATTAQQATGNNIIATWVDPTPVPYLSAKRLVQGMVDASLMDRWLGGFTAAKPTDQHRWLTYNAVSRDNPVFARICAKAVPPLDPGATFDLGLATPIGPGDPY